MSSARRTARDGGAIASPRCTSHWYIATCTRIAAAMLIA
jgi:hypothetical protein